MTGYDAVVFDMDGVIFDSERETMICWLELAEKYGLKDMQTNYNACIGVTYSRTKEIMENAYGADFNFEKFAKEASVMYHEKNDGGNLPMKAGIRELLDYLKKENKKIAVASSTRRETVENQLKWAGISDYFDAVICGDMVERSKPAPDIFLKACEVLCVSPERAYAIEDSYNGIRAAHAGKLMPVMVPDLLPPTSEMHELAEAILYDLNQVKEYIYAEEKGGKSGLNFIAEWCPDIYEQTKAVKERSLTEKLPLYGVSLFVKDNIDVAGTHTTAGSLALSDNLVTGDAPIIQNLKKNGAIILGKANMTEFANFTTQGMPGGYSSRGGQVIHAVNPSLTPSGSSSGSAVAVSSGAVKAAIGTDTSFSVIACAQSNGVCGLKPAKGALSADGIIPIARTLDSAGVLAWDFDLAVRVYNGMRDNPVNYKPADVNGLRIGVNLANEEYVSEEHRAGIDRFINKLKEMGATVTTVNQPPTPILKTIMQCEFREQLEDYLSSSNASKKTLKEIVEFFEANPDTMMKYGDTYLREVLDDSSLGMHGERYADAMRERAELIEKTRDELVNCDVVFMTGPSLIMHVCGFPSATLALPEMNSDGYRRCLIMYGTDEKRLFEAVLGMEKLTSIK